MLDENGDEDESVDNEYFENYDASNCVIRDVVNENLVVTGVLVELWKIRKN